MSKLLYLQLVNALIKHVPVIAYKFFDSDRPLFAPCKHTHYGRCILILLHETSNNINVFLGIAVLNSRNLGYDLFLTLH